MGIGSGTHPGDNLSSGKDVRSPRRGLIVTHRYVRGTCGEDAEGGDDLFGTFRKLYRDSLTRLDTGLVQRPRDSESCCADLTIGQQALGAEPDGCSLRSRRRP